MADEVTDDDVTQDDQTSYLVHTDLRGIQRYVFASGELRDVVGRSMMVNQAVSAAAAGPLGVAVDADAHVRVLSAAGGRSVVWCRTRSAARAFARRYSRALLDLGSDLDAVMTQVAVGDGLRAALIELSSRAAVRSGSWAGHTSAAGLTVTEPCHISGYPAEIVEPPRPAGARPQSVTSSVAAARRLGQRLLEDQAARLLPEAARAGYTFPTKLDEMGRTGGERSLVGVVHIDLDGLGDRLTTWLRQADGLAQNTVERHLKVIEDAIDGFVAGLARHLTAQVIDAVKVRDDVVRVTGLPERLQFSLTRTEDADPKVNLPMRPVLVGGDDITVLCDGRLAWSLAFAAFDYLSHANPPPALAEIGGVWRDPLTACVGIAVTPIGFPFARGYAISARLCRIAKSSALARQNELGTTRESTVAWFVGDAHEQAISDDAAVVYPATQLRELLDDFLDPDAPSSLRGTTTTDPSARPWADRRTWIKNHLDRLVAGESGGGRAFEEATRKLAEVRHLHGDVQLPHDRHDWARRVRDAIDLMDRHLTLPRTPSNGVQP